MPFDDLAGVAVNNFGRLGDKYSHRHDAAFAHNYPFNNLRASADKAIVADDRRIRLHRFKHAANPSARRNMAIFADLST